MVLIYVIYTVKRIKLIKTIYSKIKTKIPSYMNCGIFFAVPRELAALPL